MPRENVDNQVLSSVAHKKIIKFTKKMLQRYGAKNYPVEKLIEKTRSHMNKFNISNQEFEIFINYLNNLMSGRPTLLKQNQMANMLGAPSTSSIITGQMKFNSSDKAVIDKIVELVDYNRTHYTNAIIQSMAYNGPQNLISTPYEPGRDNPSNSVPAIIAALFINKIDAIDNRFLKSNLANIIKERVSGHAPRFKNDLELFMDLIQEPADLVCNEKTLYRDILKRCELQHSLRDMVWKFRNGQIYNQDYSSFLSILDQCKSGDISHSPHLLYIRDEGTILKKILESLSFNPIKVMKKPLNQNISSIPSTALALSSIKSVPLIEVRLTTGFNSDFNNLRGVAPVDLLSHMNNQQWIIGEGGKNMILQQNEIVYCKDIVIFYVNRRHSNINFEQNFNNSICHQPITIDGNEVINPTPVKVEYIIPIAGADYHLQSVVICNTQTIDNKEIIIGNSTIFITRPSQADLTSTNQKYYWYDPINAINTTDAENNHIPKQYRKPILEIEPKETYMENKTVAGFEELASHNGTIYIYSKMLQEPNC
jgi:hypothetical protein